MSYILVILVGGAVGVIAKKTVPTRQNLFLSILSGATGALLGLWLFSDILGIDPIVSFGTISITNIFYGAIGAIFYIALVDYTLEYQGSVKKYEFNVKPIHINPVYAHQFEKIKVKVSKEKKHKKSPRK